MAVRDTEAASYSPMLEHPSLDESSTSFPELSYNLREHKRGIAIGFGLILSSSVFLNLALFYGLWYGSNLKHTIVVAIPAAIFGVTTIPQFFVRLWKLVRKDDSSRPLGASRFALDFFQYGYLIGIITITIEEVVGTTPSQPYIRLLAMAPSSLMFELATLLGFSVVCSVLHIKAPFRFSSVARGHVTRPGVYTIIEDMVAVDGGAGKPYREALNARYEASPDFRRLMLQMSVFWCVGLYVFGGAVMAVVFTVKKEVAYGLGWVLPFVIVACMAVLTVKFVQRSLTREVIPSNFGNERK